MSTEQSKINLLVFAPHPDDAELFCGGIIRKAHAQGHSTGVIDLSAGELSSQGTAETRKQETVEASKVLGLTLRENLGLPDGAINMTGSSQEAEPRNPQLEAVVSSIRRHRPELVLAPYWQTRHPDHGESSKLVSRAVFFAGVKKYLPTLGPAHAPAQLLYYQMRFSFRPSLIVDISPVYNYKVKAIQCYQSQISRENEASSSGPPTLISSPLTLSSLEARDRYYGAMIGVEYGEPLASENVLAIDDPVAHFRKNEGSKPLLFPGSG